MVINGKYYEEEFKTLKEIINFFNLNQDHIVIELNKEIINRQYFDSIIVPENSKLEIVTFVGGG